MKYHNEAQVTSQLLMDTLIYISKNEGEMGFCDLHCFNQAMLAKQCWRLLSDPESLCAQVLRVKYYADGDLINAVLKKSFSFTWQSIMAGLKRLTRDVCGGQGTVQQ
jgi:hypothetical protein